MKHIAFIIPAFNEQDNLPLLYRELNMVLPQQYTYQFVIVDDSSRDKTWDIVRELITHDARVGGIRLSRNFGHQLALTAGYDVVDADAVISIDADLQDSPHIVPDMIRLWEQGANIVYVRRTNRCDGWLKRKTAEWYYQLIDAVADVHISRNVGDFRLIDKKVLEHLKSCRENARYLRGIVAWIGYKHAFIDFVRPNRVAGTSGYSWSKMIKLAFDGLTNFSLFPLRMAGYMSFMVTSAGMVLISYCLKRTLINNVIYSFEQWLLLLIVILIGMLFCALWLLGEYIGRIYDQEKGRPLYIVQDRININGVSS